MHTSEPWEVHDYRARSSTGLWEGWGVVKADSSGHFPVTDEGMLYTDAARIVACVNALAGLNPEGVRACVEALELAVRYLEHPDVIALPFAMGSETAAQRARVALAKVQGTP